MLDSRIFSVITHALLTEKPTRRKACRITETPRSAQIAQLVEQRIENPRVRGSNPRLGTTFLSTIGCSHNVDVASDTVSPEQMRSGLTSLS